jgi:peptide/nickel transport system permease protein
VLVVLMIVIAAGADWIAPYHYGETIGGANLKPPGRAFLMGTDNLGRDVFSRVVYGARISISVGFGAVLLSNVLAALLGITSGYFGGKYDIVVQRVVDAWQSFPFLVVILSIMAVLGPGLVNVILALGVLGSAGASRIIRGATIAISQNQYVEAARALGAGHLRIMARYLLPNVMGTLIVLATIGLGAFILAESALSFLGFGVPPPYPSWGGMLSGSGRSLFYRAPWMAIWPGAAISLAVFGFNMLGDALRDVLDPQLRGVQGRLAR